MKKKRNIINKKLVTGLITSSLLLTSCGINNKDEKTPETVVVVETVIVTPTPTPTPIPTPETTLETTLETTFEPTPKPSITRPAPTINQEEIITPPTEYHSADDGLNATLDSIYNKINYINYEIDTFDYNEFKEESINYAKELIDFIFYGVEIDGVTFDELKDDAKEAIYEKLQAIDAILMQIDPDYKEKIGEKYNLVKEFALTTLEQAKEIFSGNIDIDIDININVNSEKGNKKILKINK